MVDFETIKTEEVKFGNNKFLEVARKKAVSENGETEFISIARGFFTPTGEKRFKKGSSVALPVEKEVVDFVSKKLKEML